jgi:hypothetical protein
MPTKIATQILDDGGLQMIWGARSIGAVLNLTERQAFFQLEAGRIPGARKFGRNWGASGLVLRRVLTGEARRSMLEEKPPPGQEDGFSEMSSSAGCLDYSEIKPPRPNTQIKFQAPAPAEFDAETALVLAASGWRVAAHLLMLAAKCVEAAGDFLSASLLAEAFS